MTETRPSNAGPAASGAMARRIRDHDWAATSLGPYAAWSEALRAIVDLMLATPTIASLAVGPDRLFLYNDAASAHYGDRHPAALGRPLAQVFAHEVALVAPFYDQVFAGESLQIPAQPLDPGQSGRTEIFEACLIPVRDAAGAVIAAYMTGTAVTARLDAEARLRDSERRFRGLVEGMPQIVWRAAADGGGVWVSPQGEAFTGRRTDENDGWGWLSAIHPDDRDRVAAEWCEAPGNLLFDIEYRLRGVGGRYRWFRARAMPVRDADGAIVEWLGTSTDVDDLRRLQQHQQRLLGELQHRVRNVLAVVRSVFTRTIAGSTPFDERADHFRGRLDSIARTQMVVTQSPRGTVDLENMIRDELRSAVVTDGPGLSLRGPEVELPPRIAESLSLAVHELTTNALKFGALRVDGGRLEVEWSVVREPDDVDWLHFAWTERGVPAVPVPPVRRGFGVELVEEALPYRLDARTELAFRGSGVSCTIALPLVDETDPASSPIP